MTIKKGGMSKTTPEAQQLVKNLMQQAENAVCADCQHNPSKWASSTLGIFICYECSGIHRSLGTHISFVRSCTLDGWTPQQAKLMRRVGNKVANQYWEANLPRDFMRPSPFDRMGMENFIRAKYVGHKWAAPGDPPHITKAHSPYARASQAPQQPMGMQQQGFQQQPLQRSNVSPARSVDSFTEIQQQQQLQKPQPQTPEDSEPSAFDFINADIPKEDILPPPPHPSQPSQNSQPSHPSPQATAKVMPKSSSPPPAQHRPHFAKREPSQTPPSVPKQVAQDSSFDFINEMANQRKPQAVVVESKPVHHGQSLFPRKPRGAARFMKKPTGEAVINQMLEMSSNAAFRPVSAPVNVPIKQDGSQGGALSMFAGLDFSHARHGNQ